MIKNEYHPITSGIWIAEHAIESLETNSSWPDSVRVMTSRFFGRLDQRRFGQLILFFRPLHMRELIRVSLRFSALKIFNREGFDSVLHIFGRGKIMLRISDLKGRVSLVI